MDKIKKNGWNMLASYKEGQIIYGRDEEIASISESIQYNVQTFLYGKSGIGKTSLIQAGVFPELRKTHYFPVIIRLALYDKKETLNSIVKRLVIEEAEKNDIEIGKHPFTHNVIDDSDVSEVPLYEFFSKVRFEDEEHQPYIPVLIFDQFEETINNEDFWQRTVDFIKDDLYDLMDNSNVVHGEVLPYTNYRIVISMREDYLYCLEDIIDQFSLWELRYNRFRIKALDDAKAAEVIRKTSGVAGLESGNEDKIVDTIIKAVKLNSGERFKELNTALLSLICSLLYDNAEDACIRYKDLRNIKFYIQSFYDDKCYYIGSEATSYLEKHLLTKDGRRSFMDEAEALKYGKIDSGDLDYMVNGGILRRIKINSTSVKYEYIHDLFAKMVYNRQQENRARLAEPELRILSKRESVPSFIFKTIMLLVAISVISLYVLFLPAAISEKEFRDLFAMNYYGIVCYYMVFIASVYFMSIVTKRFHDIGKTGWLCFMVPISIFLINARQFNFISPLIRYGAIFTIGKIFGFLLIGYFVYLCLKPGIKGEEVKYIGFSKKYESIYNKVPIGNFDFIKSFSVEMIWWVVCCCMTDMLICASSGSSSWNLFHIRLNLFSISLPAAFALLPLVISMSPALRARVRSFGYPIWLSYIPGLNILCLLEGILPNTLLKKIKLINPNMNKEKYDNIYIDIYDDFIVAENVHIYKLAFQHMKRRMILRSLFIPCYGFIKAINKDESVGIRLGALYLSFCNGLIVFLLTLWLDILGCLNFVSSDILGIVAFSIIGITFFSFIIGTFLLCFTTSEILLQVIEKNPSYDVNQIAKEQLLSPFFVKEVINAMQKNHILSHIEEDGQIKWKTVDRNNYLSPMTHLLSLFVPLYGIIRGFNKSKKIGVREILVGWGTWNIVIILFLLKYLELDLTLRRLLVIALLIMFFVSLYMIAIEKRKMIILLIKEHPSYSIEEIAEELAINPSDLRKEINKMEKKGKLMRAEDNGQEIWKVVKDR